jgi:hypothetical protein
MKQTGGDKMKKVITILMALFVFGLFVGSAAAIEYEITSELKVESIGSNCSFDREFDVQTEYGYEGITLEESFYTRYMGTDGGGPISYNSIFGLYKGNSTQFENQTTAEIEYAQTSNSIFAKHTLCAKDYELGAAVGFISLGNSTKVFELFMDPVITELDLEAIVDGRITIIHKVADPETGFMYLDEVTRLDGESNVVDSFYVERLDFPAGCEDWLGCP